MAEIIFDKVTKIYKGGVKAVTDLNLTIHDGEFVVLVGPSGCGKSTALRMVAGLEEITDGTVTIDGTVVNDEDPGNRDLAMVFQNYALYPHMTVYNNIAFPLQCRKVPKDIIDKKVNEVAALLGLSEYLKRKPKTLSGGQRQRVAMGRALVREPKAFLMDEPLSNLDAKLRVQMRSEICELQAKMGITTLYVTHDQVEAMTMGSRIAIMRFGVLQQFDTPQNVFDKPANIFVASFIGSPSMNFVKAAIRKDGAQYWVDINGQRLDIKSLDMERHPAIADCVDREIAFGVRPEHFEVVAPEGNVMKAKVYHVELLGAEKLVYAEIPAESVSVDEVIAKATGEMKKSDDELVRDGTAKIVVKIDSQINIQSGMEIGLVPRDGLMHFFNLDDGGSAIAER